MPWRGRRCTHRIQPDQGNTTPHFLINLIGYIGTVKKGEGGGGRGDE